jgi:hypothetical protein
VLESWSAGVCSEVGKGEMARGREGKPDGEKFASESRGASMERAAAQPPEFGERTRRPPPNLSAERSGDSRLCERSVVPWRQPWAESKDLQLPVGFRAEPTVGAVIASESHESHESHESQSSNSCHSSDSLVIPACVHATAPHENPQDIGGPSTAPMVVSTAPQTSRKASSPRSAQDDRLFSRRLR